VGSSSISTSGLRPEGANPARRVRKFREEEKKRYLSDAEQMRLGNALADPNPMKEVHREEHISLIFRNLMGSSISIAALKAVSLENLPDFLSDLGYQMREDANAKSQRAAKQLQDAKDRYIFFQKPTVAT